MIKDTGDYFSARRGGRSLGYNTTPVELIPTESNYTGDITNLLCITTRPPKKFAQLREMIEAARENDAELFTFKAFEVAPVTSRAWYLPKRGKYEAMKQPISQRLCQAAKHIGTTLITHEALLKSRRTKTAIPESQPFFERTKRKIAVATLGVIALGFAGGFLNKNTQESTQATKQAASTVTTQLSSYENPDLSDSIPLAMPAAAIRVDSAQTDILPSHIATITQEAPNLWTAVKVELGQTATNADIANKITELGLEEPDLVYLGQQFTISA